MPTSQPQTELPVYRYLSPLVGQMRVVVGTGVLIGFAAGLLVLIEPPAYTAEASFLPQGPDARAARISGLAEQFGFSLGQTPPGESMGFYSALLRSRALLREVVTTQYSTETLGPGQGPWNGTLLDWFELDAQTSEGRVRQATNQVRRSTAVTVEPGTGLIHLRVTTAAGEMSERVTRRMLDLVNEFNLDRRQSQARAQREFVAERLREAEQNLGEAEREFEAFLEANRHYEESPQLRFEAARLERGVNHRQRIHGALAEAFEQARIEEVRNLPVVTVVDAPEGSARREPRRLLLNIALGVFAGLVLGTALVFGREFLHRQRKVFPDEYAEFQRLKAEKLHALTMGLRRSRRTELR